MSLAMVSNPNQTPMIVLKHDVLESIAVGMRERYTLLALWSCSHTMIEVSRVHEIPGEFTVHGAQLAIQSPQAMTVLMSSRA